MSVSLRTALATSLAGAAVVASTVTAGSAAADTELPTVGDQIQYTFYSDVKTNESAVWFDADNDTQSLSRANLPARSKDGRTWSGRVSFTSRSTYQMTGASIQTGGYFAACRVSVNGTVVAEDSATGRYAMAVC